jgi:hypothetical protein
MNSSISVNLEHRTLNRSLGGQFISLTVLVVVSSHLVLRFTCGRVCLLSEAGSAGDLKCPSYTPVLDSRERVPLQTRGVCGLLGALQPNLRSLR